MSFFGSSSSSTLKPKVIKTTVKRIIPPPTAQDKRQRELERERERGFPSTSTSTSSPPSSSSAGRNGSGSYGNRHGGKSYSNGNGNTGLKRKSSSSGNQRNEERQVTKIKKPKIVKKRRPSPSSSSSSSSSSSDGDLDSNEDDNSDGDGAGGNKNSLSRSKSNGRNGFSKSKKYIAPSEEIKVVEMMPGRNMFNFSFSPPPSTEQKGEGEEKTGEEGKGTGWEGFVGCKELVRDNIGKYVAYFPQDGFDVESFPTVELQYPAMGCKETFVLLAPRNANEYAPITDLWRSINGIVDTYIPTSKAHLFGSTNSTLLRAPTATTTSRPMTPLSDTGTPGASTPMQIGTPTPINIPSEDPASTTTATTTTPLPTTIPEEPIIRSLQKALNRKDGPSFLLALQRFNTAFSSIISSGEMQIHLMESKTQDIRRKEWEELVDIVQNQVYQRVVGPNVGKLKEYIAFSDNVYGELLPKFVTEIANRYKLGPNSVFVDMGSGVGNVQIQVAVQCGCEAYGGEQAPNPSALATLQIEEAKRRWAMWCLDGNQKCEAYEGDFCEDQRILKQLKRADLVLINNYAFSADLNERLSWLFLDLNPGAIIISLKPFVQDKAKLTKKMAASPLAILKVKEHRYPARSVSWTDDGGRFYEQTVDRSAIAKFMADQEGRSSGRSSRR